METFHSYDVLQIQYVVSNSICCKQMVTQETLVGMIMNRYNVFNVNDNRNQAQHQDMKSSDSSKSVYFSYSSSFEHGATLCTYLY